MNNLNAITKNLGIKVLTEDSLRNAVANINRNCSDPEKRNISREIALNALKLARASREKEKIEPAGPATMKGTRVLGINHAGPLDVTIEWKTESGGKLTLSKCLIDSGGDQVNVAKVFSHFNEKIALVAFTGKEKGEITSEWEKNFLTNNIIPSFVRNPSEDGQVAVYNIIDGTPLPGIFGWMDALSEKTVDDINTRALSTLGEMFMYSEENIWMALSAGGPVRYNKSAAYYSSLVKKVKEKYQNQVKLLIDFKHMSGPEEALSVLEIPRETPQDVIKPNIEEFIQILRSSGLAGSETPDKNTITEEEVKIYAVRLRRKYNLLGVLVSMDKSGLLLALEDRIIRERGINIKPACHTAAGDSLKAGFLYALSNGKPFEEAVHTGNLFGASTASMEGSQTVTPKKLAETETLAQEQKIGTDTFFIK
jgi:fructose-1-phosphate kinase PfkB-like protein